MESVFRKRIKGRVWLIDCLFVCGFIESTELFRSGKGVGSASEPHVLHQVADTHWR